MAFDGKVVDYFCRISLVFFVFFVSLQPEIKATTMKQNNGNISEEK